MFDFCYSVLYYIINKSHKRDKKEVKKHMVDTNKLKGAIVENGKTQQEIAEEIGIDRSTFYRKMKNGGDFSIGEVSRMVTAIPLSDDQAIQIFLNTKSHKRDKD